MYCEKTLILSMYRYINSVRQIESLTSYKVQTWVSRFKVGYIIETFQMVPRSMWRSIWPLTLDFKLFSCLQNGILHFVAAGGGGGHQCFSNISCICILQDGEESVASWELRVEGRLLEDVSMNAVYTVFQETHQPDIWGYEIYNWASKWCLTNY